MKKFISFCDRLSTIGGIASAVLMIVALSLITVEMVIRTVFSKTLYITSEYTGYITAAIAFLALAYTLKEKGHIRVNFLHAILTERQRTMLEMYAFAVGFILGIMLTVTTVNFFWDALISGTRAMTISETYLAIPRSLLPVGLSILTLQFAAEFCRSIIMLRTGQVGEVESSALGR